MTMNRFKLSVAMSAVVVTASIASAGETTPLPSYSITPLTAAGATDVYVTGVNSSGLAAGYIIDGDGVSRGMIWKNGVPSPLVGFNGAGSEPLGINNAGIVVGRGYGNGTAGHPTVWDVNGNPTDLGTLGGNGGFAGAINDAGVIVGSSNGPLGNQRAFVYTQSGGMVDYGTFNSDDRNYYAGWNAINNSGKLAGAGYRLFSPFHGASGEVGKIGVTDISPQSQFSTGMALGINDAGTIVGYQNGGSGSPVPAIFNGDGTVTPLSKTPLGFGEGWAEDINNAGTIVGRAFGYDEEGNFDQHSFIYSNGEMTDLLSLVAKDSGWSQFFNVSSINDDGTMVGAGVYNGEFTGFIMTVSTPEPASLAAGLMAIGLMRRTRR